MKPATEWKEEDLLTMITEKREESIDLDFKRAAALENKDHQKKEISKDVSAFANSAGGTIIYGLDESGAQPHYAASLTPIDPKQISKEWLEQVINSNIQPRIESVFINPVELKEKFPDNYCYVVCIPESYTAHQASDKRYYKRYNFESVAMEDYEVRQTMNRASRPAYRLTLHTNKKHTTGEMANLRFQATLENISEIVGHDVSAVLFAPLHVLQGPTDPIAVFDGAKYARIPGTLLSHSREQWTAIDPANPLTPYDIEFRNSVSAGLESVP